MTAITKEEILAECSSELIASRDCTEIARVVSIGRFKYNTREVGSGSILETLGITAGNAFLDILMSSDPTSSFRHVKPLIEQGRLLVGSPLVQATIRSMVPQNVLTQVQADTLCALGKDSNPCTPLEVAQVMFNDDGSVK